jgi:pentatricopeptide repeat protein
MVDCAQFDHLMTFISYMDKRHKKASYGPVGYVIKTLFKARKSMYGFQLIHRYFDDFLSQHPIVRPGIPVRLFEDIMVALSRAGLFHYAYHLFLYSRRYGYDRTPTMCNILLASYLKRGYMDKALETATYLQSMGGRMSSESARQFVMTLNRRDRVQAQAFINTIYKNGQIDIILYKTAIQTGLSLPGLSTPQEFFIEMVRKEIQPDRMFFMVWMKRIHQTRKDREDVEELYRLSQEYFPPNIHNFNFMIKVYLDHEKWDQAWSVVDNMKAMGILPDRYTHSTFMSHYLKSNQYEKALVCFGKLIGYDFSKECMTFLSLRERGGGDVIAVMLESTPNPSELLYVTVKCGFRPPIQRLFFLLCDLLPNHPWASVLIPWIYNKLYQSVLLEQCFRRDWTISLTPQSVQKLNRWSTMKWNIVHEELIHNVKHGSDVLDQYILFKSIAKRMDITIPHDINPTVLDRIDLFLSRFGSMVMDEDIQRWERPVVDYTPRSNGTRKKNVEYQESIKELSESFMTPKRIPKVETVSSIASQMLPVLHTAVALYRSVGKK